jgi:hypothetical protein
MTLQKTDILSPAFDKTGAFTISVKAGVQIASTTYASAAAVSMPGSPVTGADYRIYTLADGSAPYCIDYATSPTNGTDILIGGFHYSPCSNATTWNDTGVVATPQINPRSIWDIKFRPACSDPRGMVLGVNGRHWTDIYLCGVEHVTNGTSRHNVTIATGQDGYRPKVPAGFAHQGKTYLATMDWLWACRIAASHGKRLLRYEEFIADAWGVVEELGRGAQPYTTGLNTTNYPNNGTASYCGHDKAFTSCIGLIQATGCGYIWGADLMYGLWPSGFDGQQRTPTITPDYFPAYSSPPTGYSPQENTVATRGALFGGKIVTGAGNNRSGSAAADWANGIQTESANIAMRFCADHLILG